MPRPLEVIEKIPLEKKAESRGIKVVINRRQMERLELSRLDPLQLKKR